MSTLTKNPPVTIKDSAPAPVKAPVTYTTKEETLKYLTIAEKKSPYVLREGNPERVVFIPSQVTPMIMGISLDRGEYVDRFFVSRFVKSPEGKLIPQTDPDSSFYVPCKEFLEKYKHAE